MKYAIEYEHLKDELVTDTTTERHFNRVKGIANCYKIELSDEDFKRLLKLDIADKDTDWFIHKMSAYKLSLTDALISYITY